MLLFFIFQLYLHLSFSVGWILRSWMARSKGVYLKLIDNVNLFLCWIVSFSSKYTLPFTTLLGTPGGLPPWKLLSASVFAHQLPIRFPVRNTSTRWKGRRKELQACLAVAAFLFQKPVWQLLHSGHRSLHASVKAPSSYQFRPGGNHFLQLPVLGCFANPDTFPRPLHLYK